jgi:diguanylate cyclase (GGDEF)-like protein
MTSALLSWPGRLLAWWRQEFHLFRALDRDSAEFRARHIYTVSRLTPAMGAANLANGLLVVSAFWHTIGHTMLLGWLGALAAFICWSLVTWLRLRDSPPPRVSVRAVNRSIRSALILAVVWAVPLLWWLPHGDADQRLLMACLAVGMLCGGAFAMATVPQAALAYLLVLSCASVAAIQSMNISTQGVLTALVVIYSGVLGWSAINTSRAFTARLTSEREAARQGQLVSLLLRDFEEHAADFLWEVDSSGHFRHVAPRMVQALLMTLPRLQTMSLTEVLELRAPNPGSITPDGFDPLAKLRLSLSMGRAFRDVIVPVATTEGQRWWSITAKPLLDDTGRDTGWRGVITDVTESRDSHQRLAFLAHFDSLTGLANRVRLREHLADRLALLNNQPSQRIALLCLDVDHFKTINDTQGHAVGDAVLVSVAQRLKACLRQGDMAARLGGDEFALVVSDVQSDADLHALAQRLVVALCQPCQVQGSPVPIGVSVGVATAPDHGQGLDELMAHADLALYAAKDAGRGRYEVYVHRLGDRHRRRLQLRQGLNTALANGELHLHWQPRVDIKTWQVVGAEALLRWQHPTLGAIGPAEFIPVAEESGLIASIGAWVMAQACHEAMQMPPGLSISVNASAAQLQRDDFSNTVASALRHSGLAPERLEIEITESLLIDAPAVVLGHLHALRAAGSRVALDDFGTGYSSLAYLRKFPFDTLKIDRSFVRELMTREDAQAIVKTIVSLARSLGMHTLAEGVEEPAQLEVLRTAGCEGIQGYLAARPMPLLALCRLLDNWHSLSAIALGHATGAAPAERQAQAA